MIEFECGADYWYSRIYERPANLEGTSDSLNKLGKFLEENLMKFQVKLEKKYHGKFEPFLVNGVKLSEKEIKEWKNKTIKYKKELRYIQFSDFLLNDNNIVSSVRTNISPCYNNPDKGDTKLFVVPSCSKPLNSEETLQFFKDAKKLAVSILNDIYHEYTKLLKLFYKKETNLLLDMPVTYYELEAKVAGATTSVMSSFVDASADYVDNFQDFIFEEDEAFVGYLEELIKSSNEKWDKSHCEWFNQESAEADSNKPSKAILGFCGDDNNGLFVGISFGNPHLALTPTMLDIIHDTP